MQVYIVSVFYRRPDLKLISQANLNRKFHGSRGQKIESPITKLAAKKVIKPAASVYWH